LRRRRVYVSSFWTSSRQMAWGCAEPFRFRTSDNLDERFHVQRDVRHARTSDRTSRNGTGKSASHLSNTNPARCAGQIPPATRGTVVGHSSTRNASVRALRSAHRTGSESPPRQPIANLPDFQSVLFWTLAHAPLCLLIPTDGSVEWTSGGTVARGQHLATGGNKRSAKL
jgi:hypothetical protein